MASPEFLNNAVADILPLLDDESSSALINFRVLVSAKEAGCLIGQNGNVIDSIRQETNTRAGISKLQPGSYERILTVSGTLDDASKALSLFAQALINATVENQFTYSYFPLKQLLSIPNVKGKTTILRLLIPNSQVGTLIGARGLRIKEIQKNYDVLMIASNSYLPGSTERLVELQGTADDFYNAFRVILRCVIEDFSSVSNATYYLPKATNSRQELTPKKPVMTTIAFPNQIVGALIGKNGSRILGVRKVSGATIAISEVDDNDERLFTISGSLRAVDQATNLLYQNMEREEQRRLQNEGTGVHNSS